ncbi:thermonuclease family protein [Sideroxydans sp.]
MRYLNFTRLLLIGALLAPLLALAESIEGEVVGVSDGDTVTLLDAQKTQWKIRLLGIDAPEKKMPFGQKSKQHLADLVYKKHESPRVSWRLFGLSNDGSILVG